MLRFIVFMVLDNDLFNIYMLLDFASLANTFELSINECLAIIFWLYLWSLLIRLDLFFIDLRH